jgi:hypothetical protein
MKAGSRDPVRVRDDRRRSGVISLGEYGCAHSTLGSRLEVPINVRQRSIRLRSPAQPDHSDGHFRVLQHFGVADNPGARDSRRQKRARIWESEALLAAILVARCLALALGLWTRL